MGKRCTPTEVMMTAADGSLLPLLGCPSIAPQTTGYHYRHFHFWLPDDDACDHKHRSWWQALTDHGVPTPAPFEAS